MLGHQNLNVLKCVFFFEEGNWFIFITSFLVVVSRTKETSCSFQETEKLSKKKRGRCSSESLLRNSPDTRCLPLDMASVWLCVSSGMLLPFGGALKEVIKTSLFHLVRPQSPLLLRRWFPLEGLHSLVSLTLAHTFFTLTTGNTHTSYTAVLK